MSGSVLLDPLRDVSLHAVAVVLLASGIQKAFGLRAFRRGLLLVPYVPVSWTYPIGYSLPFVEIALALALLAGSPSAKVAAIGLFGVFSLVAALALWKRLAVPCNCFGSGEARVLSGGTIVLNAGLILLTLFAAPAARREWAIVSFAAAASLVLLVPMLVALRDALAAARPSQEVG